MKINNIVSWSLACSHPVLCIIYKLGEEYHSVTHGGGNLQ